MKNLYLLPAAALVLVFTTSCDPKSPDADRLVELEQKHLEAQERQRELEEQLEDVRWAAEQDAIDRERQLIAEQREELENLKNDATAAREQALQAREQELASREGRLEKNQADLEDRNDRLSVSDRQLAGREALPFRSVEQRIPVTDYGMFYDSLSTHGSWFETPDYGYVWQPVAVTDSNWRPYSRGRWACSDRGWTWISEEPFGWATYHYGRWALLRGRGWIWVPGSEWAPSWVSWRESGSHIGWAPLPPETLAYSGRHQWNSTVDERFGIAPSWYNFVETRHFGGPVYAHRAPMVTNVTIIQKTVNITHIHVQNNQVISGGPRYQQINERVGRTLPFYRIEMDPRARGERDSNRMQPRVQGDRLMVSAPNVSADWNEGLRPKEVKGRMENVEVERKGKLDREVATRYRESRKEDRQKAEKSIKKLGGREKFDRARMGQLVENRRKVAAADPQVQVRERPVREDPKAQPQPILPADPSIQLPAVEIPRTPRPGQKVTLPATPPVVRPDQVEDLPPPPARRDRTRPRPDQAPAARERPNTREAQETPPQSAEVPQATPEREERARGTDRTRKGSRQRDEVPAVPQKDSASTPMPPAEVPVEEQPRETDAPPSASDLAARQTEQEKLEIQARQEAVLQQKQEAERLALEAAREAQEAEMQARKEDDARAAIAARLQQAESEKLAKEAARLQQLEERRLQQEEMQRQKEEAATKQQEEMRAKEEAQRLEEEAQLKQEEAELEKEQARIQQEQAQLRREEARRQKEQAREEKANTRREKEAAIEQAAPERRRNR